MANLEVMLNLIEFTWNKLQVLNKAIESGMNMILATIDNLIKLNKTIIIQIKSNSSHLIFFHLIYPSNCSVKLNYFKYANSQPPTWFIKLKPSQDLPTKLCLFKWRFSSFAITPYHSLLITWVFLLNIFTYKKCYVWCSLYYYLALAMVLMIITSWPNNGQQPIVDIHLKP